ncbi:MAG TPA: SDR family NAD(P)-dependent oxidoreductase [Gemmatimonadales bacterium]|nr:SDR family NAD(P)-dependent oxidoreductase [Gemmatimonadales bacterium]
MTRLDGRTAVVTGGGRGIGRAVAEALAGAGAAVVLGARSVGEVEAAAAGLRTLGAQAWGLALDVTDPGSVDRFAKEAGALLGRVDVLVNNAGTASSAPLHRQTLEEWQRLFAVNVTGTFLCTRAFVPGMVERRWGRVVNVASVAGLAGAKYVAAYAASKHAVIGFTRSVAAEVAATGVTINAVCPGYVDTPMTDESVRRIMEKTGMSRAQALEAILGTTPQRRLIEPAEVAHAVLALCDERAKGINGQAVVIDGGALLA